MFTRLLRSTLLLIALVLIAPANAPAQPVQGDPSIVALRQAAVSPLGMWQRPPVVPVRVTEITVPRTTEVGEPVVLSAVANVRDVTLPVEIAWRFEDGTIRQGLAVEHVFETPGLHRVIFRMANRQNVEERVVEVEVLERPS